MKNDTNTTTKNNIPGAIIGLYIFLLLGLFCAEGMIFYRTGMPKFKEVHKYTTTTYKDSISVKQDHINYIIIDSNITDQKKDSLRLNVGKNIKKNLPKVTTANTFFISKLYLNTILYILILIINAVILYKMLIALPKIYKKWQQ